jgi:hypothetical protein
MEIPMHFMKKFFHALKETQLFIGRRKSDANLLDVRAALVNITINLYWNRPYYTWNSQKIDIETGLQCIHSVVCGPERKGKSQI